jgi:hypothetical protein
VSGKLHTPFAFSPGESPLYSLDKGLGGRQSRSGLYGEVKTLDRTGT